MDLLLSPEASDLRQQEPKDPSILTPTGGGVAVLPGGGPLQPGAVLLGQRPAAPAVNTVHPPRLKAAATDHRVRPPRSRTPLDVAEV